MNWTTLSLVTLLAALLGACTREPAPPVAPAGPHYRVVTQWGTPGKEPGQLDSVQGLAVDSEGVVYVADAGNCRVQVFASTGQFVRTWGACGEGHGELRKPVDVAVAGRQK